MSTLEEIRRQAIGYDGDQVILTEGHFEWLLARAERVDSALSYATWGAEDGEHHKAWTIDQIVRALTGCPMVTRTGIAHDGRSYEYPAQGESDEYRRFLERQDGDWDEGIVP